MVDEKYSRDKLIIELKSLKKPLQIKTIIKLWEIDGVDVKSYNHILKHKINK
jgi:hypothetical protein